jgi:hypothetical protein
VRFTVPMGFRVPARFTVSEPNPEPGTLNRTRHPELRTTP